MTGKRITAVAAITLTIAAAISPVAASADNAPAEQTITVSSTADPTVTLSITLDPDASGGAVPDDEVAAITTALRTTLDTQSTPEVLTPEATSALEADIVSPDDSAPEQPGGDVTMAPARQEPGGGGGRAVLKCYDKRSWTDARGTFRARHNCAFNNINWGYTIAPSMQAIISGPVQEAGLRWWKNGKSQSANGKHLVDKGYFFHGTIGRVESWDVIDYQDYMTFRVNVGGRPGKGSLAFAGTVVALRG